VRVKMIMAALVAAALLGGGLPLRAMTASGPWLQTGDAYHDDMATPNLPFVVDTSGLAPGGPGAAINSPFAFSAASQIGQVSASGAAVALSEPQFAGPADSQFHALRDFELVDRLAGGFAFGLGYDFDQGRRFGAADVRGDPAFAGLFAAPSDFNWSGFGESGFHAGASLGLGNGVSLNFGGSESGPDRSLLDPSLAPYPASDAGFGFGFGQQQSDSVLAGVDWKFAPWASVDLSAAHDGARADFAGGTAGALSFAKASSDTVGASDRVALGKGWVTSFSYNEGVTQLNLKPGVSLVAPESQQRSQSYGMAVAKHGLFGDDALGIAVSRPLNLGADGIGHGSAPVDPFDGFISANTHPILGGQSSETDLQLGYVTTFMDGALALQANAGYQMNAQGQPGTNGVTVLSRAKINF
jgi:hypothetical protein